MHRSPGCQLPDTNLAVLAFGLAALALLLLGLPVALFVVVISIIVLSVTPLGDLGFNVVGALPQGLPDFHVPGLRVRPCYYELA
jgi:SulP family sulfate permease